MDQFPRLGKRELIYLLLFTRNYVVSIGEVCSSSGCLGWATLFYCVTLCAYHIIILVVVRHTPKLDLQSRCISNRKGIINQRVSQSQSYIYVYTQIY